MNKELEYIQKKWNMRISKLFAIQNVNNIEVGVQNKNDYWY